MKMVDNNFGIVEKTILLLCNENYESNYELIQQLTSDDEFDWNLFMGILISNRVVGTIFKHIKPDLKIPTTVYRNIEYIYYAQIERNICQKTELRKLAEVLEQEKVNYSFLKGSLLNYLFYSKGERVSNDTDVLVDITDLDKVIKICQNFGYIQGRVESNKIIPATRKEIMFKKLNTYETVPFIRATGNKYMPFHEIDLNYKLGNDDTGIMVKEMLKGSELYKGDDLTIRGMSIEKNLIYLCIHIYREAVMVFKIVRGDDLLLYKFLDIHKIISKNGSQINWNEIFEIAKTMNRIKDIHYTLFYTNMLFPETIDERIMFKFAEEKEDYLDQYRGRDNTEEVYKWEIPFCRRMFNPVLRVQEAKRNIDKENIRFNEIEEKIRVK